MDPVPKAAAHVAKRRAADIAAGGDGLSGYHYEQVALSSVDGNLTLYLPQNPDHVSASTKTHSNVNTARMQHTQHNCASHVHQLTHVSLSHTYR
jgi:hypothetical protein